MALAKMQHLWSIGRRKAAAKCLRQLVIDGVIHPRVLEEAVHLLSLNFDLDNLEYAPTK